MNTILNIPFKICIGFIVTFIFLSIFTGGVGNAVGILLASIVCTAGIGLIFWAPLWLGVGVVTYWLYEDFGKHKTGVDKVHSSSELLNKQLVLNDRIALINYIRLARSKNFKDDTIFNTLIYNGWKQDVVKEAFKINKESV